MTVQVQKALKAQAVRHHLKALQSILRLHRLVKEPTFIMTVEITSKRIRNNFTSQRTKDDRPSANTSAGYLRPKRFSVGHSQAPQLRAADWETLADMLAAIAQRIEGEGR